MIRPTSLARGEGLRALSTRVDWGRIEVEGGGGGVDDDCVVGGGAGFGIVEPYIDDGGAHILGAVSSAPSLVLSMGDSTRRTISPGRFFL